MVYFDNDVALDYFLYNAAKKVVENVAEKVVQEVKNRIDIDVYSAGNLRRYYAKGNKKPTYDFRDSWDKKVEESQMEVSGVVYQEYQLMILDADNFIHGSRHYKKGEDVREFLAKIINEGKSGAIFGYGFWREKRPFWDNAMKILEDGTIDKWIKEEFAKAGFEIE